MRDIIRTNIPKAFNDFLKKRHKIKLDFNYEI